MIIPSVSTALTAVLSQKRQTAFTSIVMSEIDHPLVVRAELIVDLNGVLTSGMGFIPESKCLVRQASLIHHVAVVLRPEVPPHYCGGSLALQGCQERVEGSHVHPVEVVPGGSLVAVFSDPNILDDSPNESVVILITPVNPYLGPRRISKDSDVFVTDIFFLSGDKFLQVDLFQWCYTVVIPFGSSVHHFPVDGRSSPRA